jgi:ornithine cyclodeaminase/alanine dehydrogenase-like protein (mu-crystallin family)
VRAHASVRPIRTVTLWNRTRKRAVQTAFGLSVGGLEVEVADDLFKSVGTAIEDLAAAMLVWRGIGAT